LKHQHSKKNHLHRRLESLVYWEKLIYQNLSFYPLLLGFFVWYKKNTTAFDASLNRGKTQAPCMPVQNLVGFIKNITVV